MEILLQTFGIIGSIYLGGFVIGFLAFLAMGAGFLRALVYGVVWPIAFIILVFGKFGSHIWYD